MSQIFKDKIPDTLIFDFIEKYGEIMEQGKAFVISKNSYKKAQIENGIESFFNNIKKYYFKSKQFYLERKKSYKNFITIVRQICKHNKIPFSSKIFYSNSNYEIKYYIYVK